MPIEKVGAFCTILLMGACSSPHPLDVGSNNGSDAGDAGPSIPTGPGPGPDDTAACRNGPQLPILGIWEGYVENFKLSSGSDKVRLAITSATSSQACGKLTLGTATPPAPATDPDIGYPPGYQPMPGLDNLTIDLSEGYPMTIVSGMASSSRMTFSTDWRELWRSWCALQTPVPLTGEGYGCLGASGGSSSDTECWASGPNGGLVPVDCGKLALCGKHLCTCTMTACSFEPTSRLSFDLRLVDEQANGSVKVDDGTLHNVYFTRSK